MGMFDRIQEYLKSLWYRLGQWITPGVDEFPSEQPRLRAKAVLSSLLLIRRLDKSGYEATMGDIDSTIIVGGRDIKADEFVPSVNISAHGDEAWLDINHIDSTITSRIDYQEGDVIKHGNHEFYAPTRSGLKWDILYNTAGDIPNSERFKVTHSPGLTFYKQVLSAEQILSGDSYVVPEAAGSYAVYMDKRDNKYKTGKVCHIYSPYFVDEAGAKSPLLDMTLVDEIDGSKTLTLIVTRKVREWIDHRDRVGIFRLDPVLGYDTVGSLAATLGPVWHTVATQSDATGGEVIGLHCAIGSLAGEGLKMSVANCAQTSPYDPEGYSLVAEANSLTSTVSDDIELDNLVIYAPILPNTWYRVGWASEAIQRIKYDNVASYQPNTYTKNYASEMQNPVPTTSNATNSGYISAWAVYEPSGGAGYYYQMLNNNRRGRA
jgi:hypothetical protein